MINLRYHIVSITAVFLALGLGIATGSSFLGARGIDQVERNVDNARREAAEARAARDELSAEVADLREVERELLEEGSEAIFSNDLADLPVVVLTVDGIDEASFDALRAALESSRAQFEGTLRVNEKLVDDGAADELAEVIGEPTLVGAALRGAVVRDVADEMLDHGAKPDGEASEARRSPTTTRALVEAGFLGYEAAPDGQAEDALLAASDYRYVVVTGADADVPDIGFLLPLLQAMTADDVAPVVVATAATGEDAAQVEQDRAVPLAPLRTDDTLADRLSTVDDLESFAGIAAVVRVVATMGDDEPGHFGHGEGSDRLLPEP